MSARVTTTCAGPDCDRIGNEGGLCHAHREQLRRRGGVDALTPLRPMDPHARFFTKVTKHPSGCWLWNGATDGDGRYGSFQFDGKVRRSHRVSYEWAKGPIPDGLVLDHLCRTTLCVNPAHLEPVTQRENIMRGESLQAKNAIKTHCKRGHPFNEENTYRQKNGGRMCRACQRWYRRLRAQLAAQSWDVAPGRRSA